MAEILEYASSQPMALSDHQNVNQYAGTTKTTKLSLLYARCSGQSTPQWIRVNGYHNIAGWLITTYEVGHPGVISCK